MKFRVYSDVCELTPQKWCMYKVDAISMLDDHPLESFNTLGELTVRYNHPNLMQWTSLKDKNGLDIYEGDFIRITEMSEGVDESGHTWTAGDYIGQVMFSNGIFGMGIEGQVITFQKLCRSDQVEVIGNIFEDCELWHSETKAMYNKEWVRKSSLLSISIYRALSALNGGDVDAMLYWLTTYNSHIEGIPFEIMKTISGLNRVYNYLSFIRRE